MTMTITSADTAVRPPRPYQSYTYAYPHKTAYRPLTPGPYYARARKLYWDFAHAIKLAA
jgi:hypothetical protein